MAKNIEIGVNINVDRTAAEMSLRILELYLIKNEDETIRVERNADSVIAFIAKRKCDKTPDDMGGFIIKWLE